MALLYCRDENGVFKEVPCIVGRSAYQTAVKNGFTGTEMEWLETLKGEPGATPVKGVDYTDGYTPQKGVDYVDGKDGKDGKDGADGITPVKGKDYWTEADKNEIKSYVSDEVIGAEVVPVTTDRTLRKEDAGKFLCVEAAAYITVPANVFSVGVEIEIFRNTVDGVRIGPADGVKFAIAGNVALVSSYQDISETYASVVLKHISTNVWSIQGAI